MSPKVDLCLLPSRTRPPSALLLGLVSGFFLSSIPAASEPEAALCRAPDVPMTALPDAILAEYRADIAAESEGYFGAVSDYIACLDAERARAMAEARVATDAYATLLDTIPAAKDRP